VSELGRPQTLGGSGEKNCGGGMCVFSPGLDRARMVREIKMRGEAEGKRIIGPS